MNYSTKTWLLHAPGNTGNRAASRSMLLAVVMIALVLLPNAGYSETAAVKAYRQQLLHDWAWANESWSGNDVPYQQIMAEIDQTVAKGQNLSQLLTNDKALARDSRANPIAQFRWAYLAYKMSNLPGVINKDDIIGLSINALGRPSSPRSYHYDRLRYLMLHQIGAPDYHMVPLGKRLLKLEPDNRLIMLGIILDLGFPGENVADRPMRQVLIDRKEALTLAQRYVDRFPTSPKGYLVLGDIYSDVFLSTNDPHDRDNTILALKKGMSLLPADSASVQQTQIFIKRVKDGLALYKGMYVYKDSLPQ